CSKWAEDDLDALQEASKNTRLAAILVPKVSTVDDIQSCAMRMNMGGFGEDCALWAMIETPLAVLNIAEIAKLGSNSPLTTFVMGFNDLAKEMRAEQSRALFTPAMAQTIMAARAYGLNVIDSVYNDFKDLEGFKQECEQAHRYGFDGKSLIHPSQIEIANAAFAPSKEKVAEAKAIIAAFADPANIGKGAITIDGRMTELLHLKQAKQTVAMAKAIAAAGQ
ncbi:Citrate lyase beta chain, partial [hydrothermal vent metagenome]